VPGRRRVEDDAAAERVGRGDGPDDDPIASRHHDRRLEPQLAIAAAELGDTGGGFPRAVVHLHPGAVRGAGVIVGPGHRAVHPEARPWRGRIAVGDHHVPALGLPDRQAGQVEGHPLAGPGALGGLVVDLDGTDPRPPARWQQPDRVAAPHLPRPERAGHHRPGAADGENAVDVQSRPQLRGWTGRYPIRRALERGAKLVEPGARAHADRHALGVRQQLGRLRERELRVGEVRLGDRDDARADPERGEHRRVLAGLRHHPVVGGDDHQEQVDARRPGHHRAHEALVAGDVDHRQLPAGAQPERGEAELDRDPPGVLLGQPVGVPPGEGGDERGLAVIDVSGGAQGERLRGHGGQPRC
jgi:hypothetical protein